MKSGLEGDNSWNRLKSWKSWTVFRSWTMCRAKRYWEDSISRNKGSTICI